MAIDYNNLPEFIQADADQIIAEANAYYEGLTGKTLQPAQVEALVIRACAYVAKLSRDGYNDGGRQQLLAFSRAPMLDLLVELLGVVRLPAQPAVCGLEFVIVQGHTGVIIPAGTRVQSSDGKMAFATTMDYSVPVGTYAADVPAEAVTPGIVGNGYTIGAINNILDPQAFIISASNVDISAGGADEEDDDQLRERAKLAPNQYSVAGSTRAYKFHTLSAHPSIVSAEVLGKNDDISIPAGEVWVYPLVKGGGTTPAPVLAAVLAALSRDEVRPLNDTVLSISPTAVSYNIAIALTTYNGSDDSEIVASVSQLLSDHAQELKAGLGLDVVLAKLSQLCMIAGVYEPVISSPSANVSVGKTQYASIGTVTVTIGGHTNG